jgi:hypothetical protein
MFDCVMKMSWKKTFKVFSYTMENKLKNHLLIKKKLSTIYRTLNNNHLTT